jgi:hypothetical protein
MNSKLLITDDIKFPTKFKYDCSPRTHLSLNDWLDNNIRGKITTQFSNIIGDPQNNSKILELIEKRING